MATKTYSYLILSDGPHLFTDKDTVVIPSITRTYSGSEWTAEDLADSLYTVSIPYGTVIKEPGTYTVIVSLANENSKWDDGTTENKEITVTIKKTFTVTFKDGETIIYSQTVTEGNKVIKPETDPEKTGYKFIKWDFDFNTIITEDTTINAQYKKYVTVTFDTDGGSAIPSQTILEGRKATQPTTNPTKTGYNFTGWDFDFVTAITEDKTVTAQYEIISYTVTFDTKGGSTIAAQTVNHGSTATQPAADPTKEGKVFAGWDFDFTTPITKNTVISVKDWTDEPVVETVYGYYNYITVEDYQPNVDYPDLDEDYNVENVNTTLFDNAIKITSTGKLTLIKSDNVHGIWFALKSGYTLEHPTMGTEWLAQNPNNENDRRTLKKDSFCVPDTQEDSQECELIEYGETFTCVYNTDVFIGDSYEINVVEK